MSAEVVLWGPWKLLLAPTGDSYSGPLFHTGWQTQNGTWTFPPSIKYVADGRRYHFTYHYENYQMQVIVESSLDTFSFTCWSSSDIFLVVWVTRFVKNIVLIFHLIANYPFNQFPRTFVQFVQRLALVGASPVRMSLDSMGTYMWETPDRVAKSAHPLSL